MRAGWWDLHRVGCHTGRESPPLCKRTESAQHASVTKRIKVGTDRTRGLFVVLMAVTITAAACTRDEGRVTNPTPTSGAIPEGGTLRVAIPKWDASPFSEGPALDPQVDYWYDSFELFRCCLLRTLLAHPGLSTDEGGTTLRPDLAATMPEVSGDGLTWTFRLKDGIAYGPPLEDTQVVAGDIIRALDREAVMASGDTYAFYYSVIEGFDAMVRGEADSISGMEAPDDLTLVVHLTHPAGDLADLFAMPATAPIPAAPSEPSTRLGVAGVLMRTGASWWRPGPT